MSTITVTSLNDTGTGSLRAAIDLAETRPGPDTIVFAANLAGKTITLSSGVLEIAGNSNVIIDGDRNNDGKADITLSGGSTQSLFVIADGARATLDGLRLTA